MARRRRPRRPEIQAPLMAPRHFGAIDTRFAPRFDRQTDYRGPPPPIVIEPDPWNENAYFEPPPPDLTVPYNPQDYAPRQQYGGGRRGQRYDGADDDDDDGDADSSDSDDKIDDSSNDNGRQQFRLAAPAQMLNGGPGQNQPRLLERNAHRGDHGARPLRMQGLFTSPFERMIDTPAGQAHLIEAADRRPEPAFWQGYQPGPSYFQEKFALPPRPVIVPPIVIGGGGGGGRRKTKSSKKTQLRGGGDIVDNHVLFPRHQILDWGDGTRQRLYMQAPDTPPPPEPDRIAVGIVFPPTAEERRAARRKRREEKERQERRRQRSRDRRAREEWERQRPERERLERRRRREQRRRDLFSPYPSNWPWNRTLAGGGFGRFGSFGASGGFGAFDGFGGYGGWNI